MQRPKNSRLAEQINQEQLLIWIIRTAEFSARKIGDLTVYAKALGLEDPNFSRKKRQFGLALLTHRTIELAAAQKVLDLLTLKCKKEANNQAYFLMLKKFIDILEYAQKELELEELEEKNERHKILSSRLNVFAAISLRNKETGKETIVEQKNKREREQEKKEEVEQLQFKSEGYIAQIILQAKKPLDLMLAMNLFLRIIEGMPEEVFLERILCAVEYLDRLLFEEVDIEYFLSFLQYFAGMEEFTIIDFKQEEFAKELENLQQTHGEWIQTLQNTKLAGKSLRQFFTTTGFRREGLELLIDLLFIKVITIH